MFTNKVTAYIDEFGNYGFKFEKPNVSSHFILSAIIVEEKDKPDLISQAEIIRKKYFQKGEMKSSSVRSNHKRRRKLIDDLMKLPFKIFSLVVDKRRIYEDSGIRHKKTFYKYLNEIFYQELRAVFPNLEIIADQTGDNEYIQSFIEYIRKKQSSKQLSLFDEQSFNLTDSESNVIVQIADIVSGSLAYSYDATRQRTDDFDFKNQLRSKILGLEHFPRTYKDFFTQDRMKKYGSAIDQVVAQICIRKAEEYINQNINSEDVDVKQRMLVIKYLRHRFLDNAFRNYISTKELMNMLESFGYIHRTPFTFRTKLIAKLRDEGVVIASCKKGYKIPAKVEELYDFVEQYKGNILPMIIRLNKCYSTIKTGTTGRVDLLENEPELKSFVEVFN